MTRLAQGRTTHLERAEIAAETLRFFDDGYDPSIRQLASALKVTPSAIYHHFDSRADIVQGAVDIVWQEILADLFFRVGDPFEAPPEEVLAQAGIAVRRAFLGHCSIAPYMAATPQSDDLTVTGVALLAGLFERLGLKGEEAAEAFHIYASFIFGTALFAASRKLANQELKRNPEIASEEVDVVATKTDLSTGEVSSEDTRISMMEMMSVSSTSPDRDEQLFEKGLRRIIGSLGPAKI